MFFAVIIQYKLEIFAGPNDRRFSVAILFALKQNDFTQIITSRKYVTSYVSIKNIALTIIHNNTQHPTLNLCAVQ